MEDGPGAEGVPDGPEATIDEVDRLLDDVEAALTRLDEGSYGTCSECGQSIDDARLSAQATVQTCGRCGVGATDEIIGIESGPTEAATPTVAYGDDTGVGGADQDGTIVDDRLDSAPSTGPAPSAWSVRAFPEA